MKSLNALFILLVSFGVTTAFTLPEKPTATYTVDAEQSTIHWTGKKVTGQHSGVIDLQEGTLDVDGDQLTGGQFTIDMSTLANEDLEGEDKAKLEGHLKSDDFFGVENHPTAQLVITQVTPQEGDQYIITGDLTIKEATHPVEFPATVTVQDGQITAEATITVDRTKYDVRYGSSSFFDNLGDKVIYDDFDIAVSLVATSDASASK